MSIVISISNLIIVIFVSSSFVSYVCKYRNFVSFGMCAALKKKKKKHCYFKTCLPTRQNGVENRDKAHSSISSLRARISNVQTGLVLYTMSHRCVADILKL